MNVKRHFRGFYRRTIALGLLFLASLAGAQQPLLDRVDAVGMTVADLDRAVDFYSKVLTFEKVSDTEVAGRLTSTCKGSSGCGCT
jgi:4-hydroxyphenylpyruvate dioxygenase-like putative hemolysin